MKNIVPAVFILGIFAMIIAEMIIFHSFWTALTLLFLNIKTD